MWHIIKNNKREEMMRKIIFLVLTFLFLVSSSSVFAGQIGRVTQVTNVGSGYYEVLLS